jgi:cytochrome P450
MNCLRCLADNPDVQEKLRAEVQSAVNGDRSLNAVKFNNVPYLRAFIKEAFRYSGSINFLTVNNVFVI